MRTSEEAITWMREQAHKQTTGWYAMCLRSVRMAYGLPVVAPSAREAWRLTPHKHRHHTDPEEVPPGAFCYAPIGHWGHAWLAAHHHNGHRIGWTVDYRHKDRINAAPLALPHWTHSHKVYWSDHLTHHKLHL